MRGDPVPGQWRVVRAIEASPSPLLILTEIVSLYFFRDLAQIFKETPFYGSAASVFKKTQSTLPPQVLGRLDQMKSVFRVRIKLYKDYTQFRNNLNRAVFR